MKIALRKQKTKKILEEYSFLICNFTRISILFTSFIDTFKYKKCLGKLFSFSYILKGHDFSQTPENRTVLVLSKLKKMNATEPQPQRNVFKYLAIFNNVAQSLGPGSLGSKLWTTFLNLAKDDGIMSKISFFDIISPCLAKLKNVAQSFEPGEKPNNSASYHALNSMQRS